MGILAIPAKIQGRFWPILIVLVAGRYSSIWPDSGQISPVRRESEEEKKKKKLRCDTDARATVSDSGAAPSQPRPCFPVKHPHWWSHKFSYLASQKSILSSHFTKHSTSVVLFWHQQNKII